MSWQAALMIFAALSASMVTSSGRAGWFSGVLLLAVYVVFALALYLRPA